MVLATWAIPMILLFIAAYRGVAKGIELFNLIMMPLLFIFGVILAARSITLGAPIKPEWSTWAGLWYAWKPDFDYLAKNFWSVTLAATGQIFFTLSLGMGIIQNYASYIKKGEDIALGVMTMTSLNEFAEVVLGGSIAVPLAYAYLGPEVVKAGSLGLAFMALPNIFVAMGSIGRFFGVLWFLLLFFAGWTSAIAMYNYLVAMFEEELGIKRKIGSVIVFILYFLLGLPIALDPSLTYFDELDFWVGSFVLIVLGLFDVIVGVWLFKPSNLWRELHDGALVRVPEVFKWILIAITPIYIVILLVGSMVDYYLRGRFAVADPLIIGARIAVIIMFIIGAIETYYALKKKYAKELAENRKIIIVE